MPYFTKIFAKIYKTFKFSRKFRENAKTYFSPTREQRLEFVYSQPKDGWMVRTQNAFPNVNGINTKLAWYTEERTKSTGLNLGNGGWYRVRGLPVDTLSKSANFPHSHSPPPPTLLFNKRKIQAYTSNRKKLIFCWQLFAYVALLLSY